MRRCATLCAAASKFACLHVLTCLLAHLPYLLRQSPEDCREAHPGIAEAAEHQPDAAEGARLVFLARVAELRAGSIVVD